MTKRKKIPAQTEARVLSESLRRCALCFALKRDFGESVGQIDHVDGDRNNNDFDNLVYLCLEHHARKGSRTSQSKNFTKLEIKKHRDNLYEYVKCWKRSKAQQSDDGRPPHKGVPRAPRKAVTQKIQFMESWNAVKSALQEVAERHGVKTDLHSLRLAADDLQQANVISIHLAQQIRRLREIRNRACLDPNEKVRTVSEKQFLDGARHIISQLNLV